MLRRLGRMLVKERILLVDRIDLRLTLGGVAVGLGQLIVLLGVADAALVAVEVGVGCAGRLVQLRNLAELGVDALLDFLSLLAGEVDAGDIDQARLRQRGIAGRSSIDVAIAQNVEAIDGIFVERVLSITRAQGCLLYTSPSPRDRG